MSEQTELPQVPTQGPGETARWLRDFAERYSAGTLKDVREDCARLEDAAKLLDLVQATHQGGTE